MQKEINPFILSSFANITYLNIKHMKQICQFFFFSSMLFVFVLPISAQEDKERKEMPFNRNTPPLNIRNSELDSLRMPHQLKPFLNRLDLIDKSSLLDLDNNNNDLFRLPSDTSYYMRRITLLRMFYNPQSQKFGKDYNKMYKNNISDGFRNYLKDLGPASLYSGCLDPVEAIRDYKKEMRARKVREIISKLNKLQERDSSRFTPEIPTLSDDISIQNRADTTDSIKRIP